MDSPRKAVTVYIERSSWLKTHFEVALVVELLDEGRMRIRRLLGIGLKGIPDKIVADQSFRDGPVEVEVLRGEAGESALDVFVGQVEDLAAGHTVWVVSALRDRPVFYAKSERGVLLKGLVRQAVASLGATPRATASLLTARRTVAAAEELEEVDAPPARPAKRARHASPPGGHVVAIGLDAVHV